MNSLNKLISTAIIVISPLLSFSQTEWVYISRTADKEKTFIQSSYTSKDENIFKAWVKITNRTLKYKGHTYKNAYTKALVAFDCEGRMTQSRSVIDYTSTGNIIRSSNFVGEFEDVVPDSQGEAMLNKACELFKNQF